MMDDNKKKIDDIVGDYKFGFRTENTPVINTGKGLNEETVRAISRYKNEPSWMLDFRLKSYKKFLELKNPKWGPDLSFIKFDEITYFLRASDRAETSWDEVPKEIKDTFEKLGIPEAERNFLAGVSTQFESEVVYHNTMKELDDLGVIYVDTDTALRDHPELVKKYFGKIIPYSDNKYAALNSAVWSGGSFIYVPKGVKVPKPLQSYFRINSEQMGQFERTLIVVDEGASVNYVEGCTAPTYTKDSLHAAIVEIVVEKDATCRYTTIQNWSNNVINLVTKRAFVYENGHMEWIDGNIGSSVNMKYPSCILLGQRAKGTTISIAFAGKGQIQDAGAKMIHVAPNTTSTIISKSISRGGGSVNYRGKVDFGKKAKGAKAHVECDTIILDDFSFSDTIPTNVVRNSDVFLEHEATVSKISEEQLFYLMSRGLTEEEATEMIVMGFIEPFAKELPMEYAIELNQLIKLEMEGSIG
jgi:Fe-S cluster assembly protein SufB